MFTQIYFHKTRVAYDIHIREAMKVLLPNGHFPEPNKLDEYLEPVPFPGFRENENRRIENNRVALRRNH